MQFVIEVAPVAQLDVQGSEEKFPVNRVFCVGRNYADHAREMGHDPDREPPFFFTKPATAVVSCAADGSTSIDYPTLTNNLHHEVELVVAMGSSANRVSATEALSLVWGYGVGIDLTRRDLQEEAKRLGRPWDMSKGFDQSAPMSALAPAATIGHPEAGRIELSVSGTVRQSGDLNQQIWSVSEVISALSHAVALLPGDLIMTGTPSGVGALHSGDKVCAQIADVAELSFMVR